MCGQWGEKGNYLDLENLKKEISIESLKKVVDEISAIKPKPLLYLWGGEPTISKKFEELIFCGDLNTPRGYEIWSDLAKRYRDNIPPSIDTTIDKNLHKSGQDIRLVIDGLFTSKHYSASQVRVVPGTSDHMAVVAELTRVS